MACTLERLRTWQQEVTDTAKWYIFVDTMTGHFPESILYFDSRGKLMWESKEGGYPQISQDGKLVFVEPRATELGEESLDNFRLFDSNGKMLWEEQGTPHPRAGISDDGAYIYTRDSIFDKTHRVHWKCGQYESIAKIHEKYVLTVRFEPTGNPYPNQYIGRFRTYELGSMKLL